MTMRSRSPSVCPSPSEISFSFFSRYDVTLSLSLWSWWSPSLKHAGRRRDEELDYTVDNNNARQPPRGATPATGYTTPSS